MARPVERRPISTDGLRALHHFQSWAQQPCPALLFVAAESLWPHQLNHNILRTAAAGAGRALIREVSPRWPPRAMWVNTDKLQHLVMIKEFVLPRTVQPTRHSSTAGSVLPVQDRLTISTTCR